VGGENPERERKLGASGEENTTNFGTENWREDEGDEPKRREREKDAELLLLRSFPMTRCEKGEKIVDVGGEDAMTG